MANGILASRDVTRYHREGTDFWVDIKNELSGYEEQARSAIVFQTRKDLGPEVTAEVDEHAAAIYRFQTEGLPDEEIEQKILAMLTSTLQHAISQINSRTAEFDMQNYIDGWSEAVKPGLKTYRSLRTDVYQWLINTINVHRLKATARPGDLSRPPIEEGGEEQAGNLSASSETSSGEQATLVTSLPPPTSETDA